MKIYWVLVSYSGTSLGFTQVEEVVICWFHIWFCQFHLKSGFFPTQLCDVKDLAKFLQKKFKNSGIYTAKKNPNSFAEKETKIVEKTSLKLLCESIMGNTCYTLESPLVEPVAIASFLYRVIRLGNPSLGPYLI